MHSTVSRITHPSRLGRCPQVEREHGRPAPRRIRRSRDHSASHLSPFRPSWALDTSTRQPAATQPAVPEQRGEVLSRRSTVWLGSWHSSQGTTSVEVRLGRRMDGGFVLYLVVRIERGDLHRPRFATDEAEVRAVVEDIGTRLVAARQLPPLAWNGGGNRTAA